MHDKFLQLLPKIETHGRIFFGTSSAANREKKP